MSRNLVRRIHLCASLGATAVVVAFLVASVMAETSGDTEQIAVVKASIVRALGVLIPLLATAGLSGRWLATGWRSPVVARKQRRMAAAAAIGVLVLVPCALALDQLAADRRLGVAFGVVQAVELIAGAANLTLLSLNFRDGMAMRRRRRAAGGRRQRVQARA